VAWEWRGRSRYYYVSRRVGGRVTKTYCGRKLPAAIASGLDAEHRERRDLERAARRALQAAIAPAERASRTLEVATKLLTEAALAAAGYRRHGHGKWTRGRT
jgi:hypothetical protein